MERKLSKLKREMTSLDDAYRDELITGDEYIARIDDIQRKSLALIEEVENRVIKHQRRNEKARVALAGLFFN